MADPRFYHRAGSLSLNDLVSEVGDQTELALSAETDGTLEICDVAPLNSAGPQDISFLDNPKYADALSATKAAAVLLRERDVPKVPTGCAAIISKDPYRAYAIIAHRFYPDRPGQISGEDPSRIDPSARIEPGVLLAPGVCIGPGVEIGSGTRIGSNTVVGQGCTIGRDCRIGANVSISYAIIGDRVGLYSGVTIGEEGFGFAMGPGGHLKVPQLGRAILQDDVEVGANSTIDRGAGPDTIIGEGTKIDNLVQIGHNVQTGRHCVLAGQVGIAGSTVLEDYVVLGGQAGIAGHLRIGTGAQIGGCSGVMRDVPAGERQVGAPARDVRIFMKESAWLSKMAKTKGKKE